MHHSYLEYRTQLLCVSCKHRHPCVKHCASSAHFFSTVTLVPSYLLLNPKETLASQARDAL